MGFAKQNGLHSLKQMNPHFIPISSGSDCSQSACDLSRCFNSSSVELLLRLLCSVVFVWMRFVCSTAGGFHLDRSSVVVDASSSVVPGITYFFGRVYLDSRSPVCLVQVSVMCCLHNRLFLF